MKWAAVYGIIVGLVLAGCAGMTKQDQDFAIQFTVMRTLESSSQPEVRAEQIMTAVHVVEGAIRPGASAMLVDQLLLMTDEWVNEQDWLASDKHAAKYIIRRSIEANIPEADLSLPIDDRLRGEIEAAMQSIREAVSLAGY